MIKPVSESNKHEWAVMNAELWAGDVTEEDALNDLADLPNEFLYYVGEEAVGFVSLSLRHDYVEGTDSNPVGYLEAIYVKSEFRKRGIAKELVNFAKDWSKKQGCTELASDCKLTNEKSRLFHTQIGFEEANRIICFTMKI